jgi:hypothetical protein
LYNSTNSKWSWAGQLNHNLEGDLNVCAQVREKFYFEAQNIYNCDETGCTTVQKCPKVVASKHCCQVGQVTSAERETLVTVCFAVNAIGNVLPPFFIFPRVKYNPVFVENGPAGSDGDSYPSGWMTAQKLCQVYETLHKIFLCIKRKSSSFNS